MTALSKSTTRKDGSTRMTSDDIHTCHAGCQRPTCVAVREAVAAERKAILETVDELTGAEQYRNAMFSDGYDYALGHVKQFIEGRAR
jgi:hypothetical protein